jgi:hypothetical protein
VLHGCGSFTAEELVFPVVQRRPTHANLLSKRQSTFLPSAQLNNRCLFYLLRVDNTSGSANNMLSRFWVQLIEPGSESRPTRIAKLPDSPGDAAIMLKVVLDGNSFLLF